MLICTHYSIYMVYIMCVFTDTSIPVIECLIRISYKLYNKNCLFISTRGGVTCLINGGGIVGVVTDTIFFCLKSMLTRCFVVLIDCLVSVGTLLYPIGKLSTDWVFLPFLSIPYTHTRCTWAYFYTSRIFQANITCL